MIVDGLPLAKTRIDVSADGYQPQSIIYEPRNRTNSCDQPIQESVTIALEPN